MGGSLALVGEMAGAGVAIDAVTDGSTDARGGFFLAAMGTSVAVVATAASGAGAWMRALAAVTTSSEERSVECSTKIRLSSR